MTRPQNSFEPHRDPKNSTIEAKKAQNNPKISPILKVRVQENLKNKMCLSK